MDKAVLEQFTLQLILASGKAEKEIETALKESKIESLPKKIEFEKPTEKVEEEIVKKIEEAPLPKEAERPFLPLPVIKPRAFIPQVVPKLVEMPAPSAFEVSKPIAPPLYSLPSIPIDLGKLNQFVLDVTISSIQGEEGKRILIKRDDKILETEVTLTATEINDLIVKFAQTAKTALTVPIFKATVGNLAISAIISDVIGSRFLISKK